MKQQQGLSLLEIMLVIAIAAAILMSGALQYKRMQWNRDLETIRASVGLVKQALNLYFYKNKETCFSPGCKSGYADVIKMLPENIRASIQNPWMHNPTEPFKFYISCVELYPKDPNKRYIDKIQRCELTITTQIDEHYKVRAGIARMLGASIWIGSNIIWHYIPDVLSYEYDPHLGVVQSYMHNMTNTLYQLDYPKS